LARGCALLLRCFAASHGAPVRIRLRSLECVASRCPRGPPAAVAGRHVTNRLRSFARHASGCHVYVVLQCHVAGRACFHISRAVVARFRVASWSRQQPRCCCRATSQFVCAVVAVPSAFKIWLCKSLRRGSVSVALTLSCALALVPCSALVATQRRCTINLVRACRARTLARRHLQVHPRLEVRDPVS
jgi:hypothetical protein